MAQTIRTSTPGELGAADAADGSGLHEAKQLRLQRQIHLGDLVEEEGAAIGELGRTGRGSRPLR